MEPALTIRSNLSIHLTANSTLRALLPPGDAHRWESHGHGNGSRPVSVTPA